MMVNNTQILTTISWNVGNRSIPEHKLIMCLCERFHDCSYDEAKESIERSINYKIIKRLKNGSIKKVVAGWSNATK